MKYHASLFMLSARISEAAGTKSSSHLLTRTKSVRSYSFSVSFNDFNEASTKANLDFL